MGKGFNGMNMGGMNMNNLMKQAQKMQKQMEETQSALKDKTLEITAGGGAVKIIINGKKEIKDLILSPEIVNNEDIEMLQDLIITSVNEAIRQADEMVNGEMSKITGGMGLPPGLV